MSEQGVTLSVSAAKRINEIMAAEGGDKMLRVEVLGGGCSGFQYRFDFADARNDDDLMLERDGARVVIDDVSIEYMRGSEIDYVDDLIGAAFKVVNPNATASCGCGTSFSI